MMASLRWLVQSWLLLLALGGLGQLQAVAADVNDTLPPSTILKEGDTFDYVVVGGGAAGCAAAARVAQAGFRVLLVEAGDDPGPLSKIPGAAMALLGSPEDWQYPTISNNISCLASRGRACRFSRGKCLGGSTSINYMIYTRGNRRDFNYGVCGWTWKDLKPYFLRYEGLQVLNQLPRSSIPYHNTTGVVKLEFFDDPQNAWQSRIFNGYRQLGFPVNGDVNGVSQIGVARVYGYVYKGQRMTTARAYLTRKLHNLQVAKNTLCTGVMIDDNKTARGVTVLPKGALIPLKIFATKEVILSAGTVGTPQILLLSGVGPAAHLKKMGIPLRANLPVGDNLSDHVLPLIIIKVDQGFRPGRDIAGLLKIVGEAGQYFVGQDGPLASDGLTDINVFGNTRCYNARRRRLQNTSSECELPTLQAIHAYIDRNVIPAAKTIVQQGVNLDDATIDQLAAANVNSALMILSPIVLHPESRGYIRLASKDPKKPPAIFANYLSDKRDVDEMLRSIKIVEQLVQTPVFKRNNAEILRLQFPGCRGRGARYWRCYVRHMTYAVFHAVGTSSLGRVVGPRLRVRGLRRLRVADASIVPSIPRGNTAALSIAIGERVAEFITNPRKNSKMCKKG